MENVEYRWETDSAANIKFEIPADWLRVGRDNISVFHSPRPGIALEFAAVESNPTAEEKLLLGHLERLLTNLQITQPTNAIHQHGLTGHACGGSAKKNGLPVEWMSLWIGDGNGKGVVVLGYASADLIATQKAALRRSLDSIQPAGGAVAAVGAVAPAAGVVPAPSSAPPAADIPATPVSPDAGAKPASV